MAMPSSIVDDLSKIQGGRGGGRGGRGRGRGGPPGWHRRGGGKTNQDERGEPWHAGQKGAPNIVDKTNCAKKVEGVAGRHGFIPAANINPNVGLGGSAPIGQGASRGFAPHGRGRGPPPPSMRIPSAPVIPAPVGILFNGVLQNALDQPAPVPSQAAPCTQVTVPSPINTQGFPNGYGGQNRGRGRGSRGGWFRGANGGHDNAIGSNNGDTRNQAPNETRGGRGWRGGYAPRGGFRGRGRGNFEGSDRGGRGRGQFGGGGRGAGPWSGRASMERRPQWEPVVDNLPPARDMRENILEPAIVEITAPDVAVADKPTNIEDFQSISSYTWAKGPNLTIIVPGLPREWLDRPMPFKVPFDSGIRMFHEDAFYMSDQSTLIPLFRAVDAMAPATEPKSTASENADAIDWATVDFVTDRNNLRKLLRWIREPGPMETTEETSETSPTNPTSDGSEGKQGSDATAAAAPAWDTRKDFRIDLQLGGANTVLMNRWASRAREVIVPPKGGCRANFELEHTAAARGCENGAGHYRIVQYNIGGLKMVVRFEVDACVPATTTAAAGSDEEAERGGSPSSPSPERNARGADVATPNPISDIAVVKSAKALAQQNFNDEDEGALWGGGSAAEDWGVAEEPPASQPSPHNKSEAKKPETEEVDFDKEAALWAGGGDDSWGTLPVPPRSSKGEHASSKGKADMRHRAPPPEDSGWDLPDDASAWGVTADTAQNEDSSVTNGELTVVRSGALLPQSSIVELATRSIKFADRTSNEDIFLQLFLTQTPTHLVAIHQYGNFEKIVRQELQSPEFVSIAEMEGIQKSLAQFVELLKGIQRLVKELGRGRRLSLVCEKGKLELFELGGEEGRLSDGELERFKISV